jgi:hypothetical protein
VAQSSQQSKSSQEFAEKPSQPEFGDHSLGIDILVGTEGFLVGSGDFSRQRFGSTSLSSAHRLSGTAVHDLGMAVVHECVFVAPQGALAAPVAGRADSKS